MECHCNDYRRRLPPLQQRPSDRTDHSKTEPQSGVPGVRLGELPGQHHVYALQNHQQGQDEVYEQRTSQELSRTNNYRLGDDDSYDQDNKRYERHKDRVGNIDIDLS